MVSRASTNRTSPTSPESTTSLDDDRSGLLDDIRSEQMGVFNNPNHYSDDDDDDDEDDDDDDDDDIRSLPDRVSYIDKLDDIDESGELFEEDEKDDEEIAKDTDDGESGADHTTHTVGIKETRQIFWARVMVLMVLVTATSLVSFALFYNTRDAEIGQFEVQFEDRFIKIIDSFQLNFKHTLESMDNLVVLISTYAATSDSPWPFVTLPEFYVRGKSIRHTSKADMMTFVPLVTNSQRSSWESYSILSSGWVDEDDSDADQSQSKRLRQRRRIQAKDEIVIDKALEQHDNYQYDEPYQDTYEDESSSQYPYQDQGENPHNGSENIEKPSLPDVSPSPPDQTITIPVTLPAPPDNFPNYGEPADFSRGVASTVYRLNENNEPMVETYDAGPYFPVWQMTPTVSNFVNYNLLSHPVYGPEIVQSINEGGAIVIGKGMDGNETYPKLVQQDGTPKRAGGPLSNIVYPIYHHVNGGSARDIAGILISTILWSDYFVGSVPLVSTGAIIAVLENRCRQQFSFEINGETVNYLGTGDQHDSDFDHMERILYFSDMLGNETTDFSSSKVPFNQEFCPYQLRVYPSQEMYLSYLTWRPSVYTTVVVLTFVFTSAAFMIYDCLVERRQRVVLESAMKSSAVISSLFPAVVRDRLFKDATRKIKRKGSKGLGFRSAKRRLKSYLDDGGHKNFAGTSPIAEFFPYTTVMFADISGFTAWSSVRDPSQVFTLLETIYGAFDKTARKRRVFKVETIGDCYVAVTGLPDPQIDHAVIMAKFAYVCLRKFNQLAESLEISLGPDTGDLKMRIGLHSGPVTAGVLRGEKSRFQLFGDTVNTAARMESTGTPGRIQCSQATGDLIRAGGKAHWLQSRDEVVEAKGKGIVKTFWIEIKKKEHKIDKDLVSTSGLSKIGRKPFSPTHMSVRERFRLTGKAPLSTRSAIWKEMKKKTNYAYGVGSHRHQRLIDWNVDLLGKMLKQIIARRRQWDPSSLVKPANPELDFKRFPGANPIDEVTEAIDMPLFDPKVAKIHVDPETIILSDAAINQLMDYVARICAMYHDDNHFHNFEHACHVTMSTNKILKRVVQPDYIIDKRGSMSKLASNLHNYTYGITSDPLTQFAIVFSALIHDVDHRGVSNGQLMKENTDESIRYRFKSIAEQNSVDLAWTMLMKPEYCDLQKCIFTTDTEMRRFRNLVVNSVIATDIFDKDLKEFRNNRWDKAFHQGNDDANLKATIVIEHIIQASDVSHTMQHWHIYQKWNQKLFHEMYSAFLCGRGGDKDPSEGWYKGELWFFDNYVIPLAKKLKECGVFGVASAECLTYALDNRREWEVKGEDIVRRMVSAYPATI